ncbi:cupin 2 conserved barrel domain protein [Saitoella complicata NRRL Y-17804]|nr:cupin 2 conserved barrel domain protein [Saitoella complicata NRRL Y-17804]ODQ55034.1 cupin 2 conserved barrel domain protein [Saitoella complicata NRRL Y-17804]
MAVSKNVVGSLPPSYESAPEEGKMQHYNIAKLAESSGKFRRVIWTGTHSQLVIMTVPVGGDIGQEVHHVDQHLSFLSGVGKAIINGESRPVSPGDLVVVPAGSEHNFINTGETPMVLYTVYAPAEHMEKTVHETKEEGDELEEAGKDEPPEWAQPEKKE